MTATTAEGAGILETIRESPRAVKALLVGVFVNRLGTFLQFFLVLFLTGQGFTELQAGFALGSFGVGSVIGVLVGGTLADRLGVRRAIMLSMVGTAVFVLAVLYLHNYPALLVAVAMVSVVGQVYRPAAAAMIAELTPQHRRVMVFAIQRLALNLGATVSPLIGAALLSVSYALLFWAQALVVLAFAAIAYSALPTSMAARSSTPDEPAVAERRGYRTILADRPFLLFLLAFFVNSVVYLQYISVLPLAMADAGLGPAWYSAMIALNGFIVITCELLGTKITQRWPMRVAGTVGFTVLAAGLAVYAVPAGATAFVIGTLVWSLAEIIAGPTMSAYPAAVAPDHARGRYIGISQAVFGIGVAVGPVVGVFAWNLVGSLVWLWYGLLCAVGFAAAWFGMARKGTQPAAPGRPATSLFWTVLSTVGTRLRRPRREPAALTLTLAYTDRAWTLTAHRRGRTVIGGRSVDPVEAVRTITTLGDPDLQAALSQVLGEQRAQAQAEAARLREALARVEALDADLAAREAQLTLTALSEMEATVDGAFRGGGGPGPGRAGVPDRVP